MHKKYIDDSKIKSFLNKGRTSNYNALDLFEHLDGLSCKCSL